MSPLVVVPAGQTTHLLTPTGRAIVAYASSAQGAHATSTTTAFLPPLDDDDDATLAAPPSGRLTVLALPARAVPAGQAHRPRSLSAAATGPFTLHARQGRLVVLLHLAQPMSNAAHEDLAPFLAAAAVLAGAVGVSLE